MTTTWYFRSAAFSATINRYPFHNSITIQCQDMKVHIATESSINVICSVLRILVKSDHENLTFIGYQKPKELVYPLPVFSL